jgi:hypothetical protein
MEASMVGFKALLMNLSGPTDKQKKKCYSGLLRNTSNLRPLEYEVGVLIFVPKDFGVCAMEFHSMLVFI